jgi:hypothetical protein
MLCTLSAAFMFDALGQFLRDQRVQANPARAASIASARCNRLSMRTLN